MQAHVVKGLHYAVLFLCTRVKMDAVTLSIRNPLKGIGGVGFGKHLNVLSVLMNRQYLHPHYFVQEV